MRPTIEVTPDHPLALLARTIDWTELEERAQRIRRKKLKNAAGAKPHLRALTGAMVLGAGRSMSYRVAEDQIRHYAPARVLCGLTETDWTPDHNTIAGFAQQLGAEGMQLFNEYSVELAVQEKLAEPSVMVADTTAQEAAIPHPNEMGLMASFITAVGAASPKAGEALQQFATEEAEQLKEAKQKVREYRLFAKKETAEETKQAKSKIISEMASLVEGLQGKLGKALEVATTQAGKLRKYGKVAHAKLVGLHETMKTLLPQIRHWLETGRVAANKIINLHIPELYSIVRGKAGKAVEFGLKWGVRRIRGGYVLLTMASCRHDLLDTDYAVKAVDEHIAFFGKPPQSYAYDRGGWSTKNVKELKERGVEEVGLAPRGKANWQVSEEVKKKLVNERSQVEGCIGAIKNPRYGFNRPRARSVEMMGFCGHRAAFGHNLNKLVRGLLNKKRWEMIG
jgi:IS5 family transposase